MRFPVPGVIGVAELVEACLVDGVEEGRAADVACAGRGESSDACAERVRIAGPGLRDFGERTELGDEGLIGWST